MCSSRTYRSRRCRESESKEGRQTGGLQLVAGHTITAGKRTRFFRRCPSLRPRLSLTGCLAFAYRLDDERSYVILERYASQEAPDAHRDDHLKNLVQAEIIAPRPRHLSRSDEQ